MTYLRTGRVAEEAGVNLQTLRYYERVRLEEIRALLEVGTGRTRGPGLPERTAAKLVEVESKPPGLEIIRQALLEAVADEHDGPAASPDWTPLSGLVDHKPGE
ncbi:MULTISPECIES: hypothetical protein [Saccharothrix]|uniref:hypothetical protein n=1 Tax=Saccharothrix TaxID=2071 RepID=UPI0009406652|nr:hypothetical protein [Saccharothrix sp. CB00851]OKI13762.1 hypothetical protein A6A25_15855 [Saccharothrix sp. CB00851]